MAEIRLFTSSSKITSGSITTTGHLEPEGDGSHEKVILQSKVDGIILPPGTFLEIASDPFTPDQQRVIGDLYRRIRALEERVPDASSD